jgi:hypothetical protein
MLELYRFNQEEALNIEKNYVRSKRKFLPFSVPGKAKRLQKFLMADFEKQ